MENALKFGDIREYVARVDKISICIWETTEYEIFEYIFDVPEKYNDYYLIGFGALDNIFLEPHPGLALEIMLSKKPREDWFGAPDNNPVLAPEKKLSKKPREDDK